MLKNHETAMSPNFEIQRLVEVPPDIEEAIKTAITMVWNKHVGDPCNFKIIFASRITDSKTGKPLSWSCEYDPGTDTFKFALDTMKEKGISTLPGKAMALIFAAHEATHKVQFYNGEDPTPSPKGGEDGVLPDAYFKDKHEVQAWEEALHVFKKIYPNARGSIVTGGQHYLVPSESKY